MGKLRLAVVLVALCSGCAGDENPAGPGTVKVTESTSTTTTTTVAPTATAQFVFAPTTPAAQQPVFFNGFGSAPGRGTKIVTFSWEFGDGGTATGMSVSHTYADQALYVVTLTVTDDVGDSAKVSQIVGAIAPPVTTTIPPAPAAAGAAQFVGNQTNPLIPSDLTLFFRLLTSASPIPEATDAAGLQAVDGDFTYTVTGTFRTPNGTTGTITGRLEGVVEPKPAGDFTGRITSNPSGCSATRNFSGEITPATLQWIAGSMVNNTCATNPLSWTSLDLVQTNAPPVTTTSISTTTTTTTVPTTTTTTTVPTTTTTTTIPTTTTTTSTTSTTSSTSTSTTTSILVLAELVPPAAGTTLCRLDGNDNLVINVRNIGKGNAVDSQTSASETHTSGGGSGTALTPAIVAGGSVDVSIPGFSACRISGCALTVTVDSQNQVSESDETNNVATGSCIVIGLR
jgi:PKD repeat protein